MADDVTFDVADEPIVPLSVTDPSSESADFAIGDAIIEAVSPTVEVEAIAGGHEVTITDINGEHAFDVMDGEDGATGPAGPGVPTGGSARQVLTKASATDYATAWATPDAADLTGTLPVAHGGTGATTADAARQALNASREWYATSSTAAATAAKTASCTGFVLEAGAAVDVRFANENTAASPTLNVNSTGAVAIYANASTTAENCKWVAGETVHFVYDGTYWRMANSVAINSLQESASRNKISSYTTITASSSSSPYTFPSDGYVFVYNASDNNSYLAVSGSNGVSYVIGIGVVGGRTSLYVRKGMVCWIVGTIQAVRFLPLE